MLRKFNSKRNKAKKRYLSRKANEPLNHFYFVKEQNFSEQLSPEAIARLIYLNSFATYNDDRLMLSERKPILKRDLPKILRISPASASRFWKEVNPTYIKESKNGLILTNRSIFYKGRLSELKNNIAFRRFYTNGVRTLYEAVTDARRHKHLGYIFQLLQYVNLEFNILCYNVEETNLDNINPITLEDFCKLIDYDYSHINRLLTIYRNLHFKVGNHAERFVNFISDGLDRQSAKIYINPHILYNGSNYKRVEILGAFCKN